VGNLLKRVDPQAKLVYGDGKCPKNTKNYQASNLPLNCTGLGKSPSKLSDNKFRGTQTSRKYKYRERLNSYKCEGTLRPGELQVIKSDETVLGRLLLLQYVCFHVCRLVDGVFCLLEFSMDTFDTVRLCRSLFLSSS